MMRGNPLTTMQKTYDDCFIVCSTAIYFESQNNEAEALRSWKNALDQLYYHNAYRVPSSYRARTETERALQDSLKQMELQCKERVDLLEALKKSREEEPLKEAGNPGMGDGTTGLASPRSFSGASGSEGWIGGGTIPPISYPDLARPPTLPQRPSQPVQRTSQAAFVRPHLGNNSRQNSEAKIQTMTPPAQLPVPEKKRTSRTPSPEKKGGMLKTLRPQRKSQGGSSSGTMKPGQTKYKSQPAAAGAATQAWSGLMRQESGNYSRESVNAARNSIGSLQSMTITSPRETPRTSTSARPSNDYTDEAPSTRRSFDSPRTASDTRGRQLRPPQQPYSGLGRVGAIRSSENLGSTGGLQKSTSMPDPPYPTHNDPPRKAPLDTPVISYRKEYSNTSSQIDPQAAVELARRLHGRPISEQDHIDNSPPERDNHHIHRKAVKTAPVPPPKPPVHRHNISSSDEMTSSSVDLAPAKVRGVRPPPPASSSRRQQPQTINAAAAQRQLTPTSDETSSPSEDVTDDPDALWRARTAKLLKNLPRGVDEGAAKQILNEIVIQGDEVHWSDVAGLDIAKTALKENVVYPFLRPDLFSGLREPARGMLLFGPPGTGKTMLARAVATESRSTFFAISASSLTSKFLGESEKLVRALFVLAKELAPSIIFVDEIDSLLSARSDSGEHEATRRIKTEFLIQWSDLARAAAGSVSSAQGGDASRVLVLAATNLPWAIDEAARRRFVRRQYIPLPEDHVRASQLRTLLSHQKHNLTERDINRLVTLTNGFSGSDITALAKDAAMGPLRSLGEMLLHTSMDAIRPIGMRDFEASLTTIRPSVSKQGLKQFEDWAAEYGERGG